MVRSRLLFLGELETFWLYINQEGLICPGSKLILAAEWLISLLSCPEFLAFKIRRKVLFVQKLNKIGIESLTHQSHWS